MAALRRRADLIGLRGALLVGVSLGTLSITLGGISAEAANLAVPAASKVKVVKAPPAPPPPPWFFLAEGGGACSTSSIAVRSPFVPGNNLAHVGNACGWTARVGFGQEHAALFGGIADYWGLFVRYTRIQDNAPVNGEFGTFFPGFSNLYGYSFNANTGFDEHRTVIDFEAGRDIGLGDGSKVRAIGGVRFAHYSGETTVLGSAQQYAVNFLPNSSSTAPVPALASPTAGR